MDRPLHRVAEWLTNYAADESAIDALAKEIGQPRDAIANGIRICAGLVCSDYIRTFAADIDREAGNEVAAELDDVNAAKPGALQWTVPQDARIHISSETTWGVSPADDEVE